MIIPVKKTLNRINQKRKKNEIQGFLLLAELNLAYKSFCHPFFFLRQLISFFETLFFNSRKTSASANPMFVSKYRGKGRERKKNNKKTPLKIVK